MGELLLPWEHARAAARPADVVLEFAEDVYDAAADRGGWDRDELDVALRSESTLQGPAPRQAT